MRLRTYITLHLIAAFLLGSLTISAGLLALELGGLERRSQEKARVLLDDGVRVAEQALVTQDILLLGGFLESLQRAHSEIVRVRVRYQGRWIPLAGDASQRTRGPLLTLQGKAGLAREEGTVQLELSFSREALDRDSRALLAQAAVRIAWLTGASGIVSVILGFVLAHRLSQPITAVMGMSQDLAEGRPLRLVTIRTGWPVELRRLTAQFSTMAARLRELDEMKRDFVTATTHELRSPLSAIESIARMLLRGGAQVTPQERSEMLQHVQTNAQRLESLVTNLLELARIEKGVLEVSPRNMDLAEAARDATSFMQTQAQERDIAVACDVSQGPLQVNADPERMQQVLINLIANAVKFSPPGKKVSVYVLPTRDWVECGVRDQGPGVSPDEKERIFLPFERGKAAGKAKGTGIGLAVCKMIVELHGGKIGVDSEPGAGSRFYFLLPTAEKPTASQ